MRPDRFLQRVYLLATLASGPAIAQTKVIVGYTATIEWIASLFVAVDKGFLRRNWRGIE